MKNWKTRKLKANEFSEIKAVTNLKLLFKSNMNVFKI